MKLQIVTLCMLLLAACTKLQEEPSMSVEIRSQLPNVLLSGNDNWVEVATTATPGTDYKILLRIVSTDGALVGSPFIDGKAPDSANLAMFNIKGRVNQSVDYSFDHPPATAVNSYDLLAFDITVEAGEYYIDTSGNPVTNWTGLPVSHLILKGGLSHLKQQDILPVNFYDDFVKQGRFLTWQPDGVKISPVQPLKLWYIYPFNDTPTLTLFLNVYYYHPLLKSAVFMEYTVTFLADDSNLYEMNLSPEFWGIPMELENGHEAKYMSVAVWDELVTTQISESRLYYFDTDYYEENTFIYFLNSIAGIDCLWCTAEVEQHVDSERTVVMQPDEPVIDFKRPTLKVAALSSQRKWELNTGHKTKEEIEALRDFALSEQMWLADGSKIIPVYLEDADYLLKQISANRNTLSFVLLEGHKEPYY